MCMYVFTIVSSGGIFAILCSQRTQIYFTRTAFGAGWDIGTISYLQDNVVPLCLLDDFIATVRLKSVS